MSKPKAPPNPRALWEESQRLHTSAVEKEAEAIRAALEQSDWLVMPAAKLLGLKRNTTLIRLLTGRHQDLGDELERQRKARGYATGNPAPMRHK